jgi:hypothetical protein
MVCFAFFPEKYKFMDCEWQINLPRSAARWMSVLFWFYWFEKLESLFGNKKGYLVLIFKNIDNKQ